MLPHEAHFRLPDIFFYSVTLLQCIGKPSACQPPALSLPLCGLIRFQWQTWTKEKMYTVFQKHSAFQVYSSPDWICPHEPLNIHIWGRRICDLSPLSSTYLFIFWCPIDKRIIYLLKGLGIICHCHGCLSGNWMCHRVASVLPCLMSQMGALTYVCLTFHAVKWCVKSFKNKESTFSFSCRHKSS